MSEDALIQELEKLRVTMKWLLVGYAVFWTVLILGSVVLYTHHLLP